MNTPVSGLPPTPAPRPRPAIVPPLGNLARLVQPVSARPPLVAIYNKIQQGGHVPPKAVVPASPGVSSLASSARSTGSSRSSSLSASPSSAAQRPSAIAAPIVSTVSAQSNSSISSRPGPIAPTAAEHPTWTHRSVARPFALPENSSRPSSASARFSKTGGDPAGHRIISHYNSLMLKTFTEPAKAEAAEITRMSGGFKISKGKKEKAEETTDPLGLSDGLQITSSKTMKNGSLASGSSTARSAASSIPPEPNSPIERTEFNTPCVDLGELDDFGAEEEKSEKIEEKSAAIEKSAGQRENPLASLKKAANAVKSGRAWWEKTHPLERLIATNPEVAFEVMFPGHKGKNPFKKNQGENQQDEEEQEEEEEEQADDEKEQEDEEEQTAEESFPIAEESPVSSSSSPLASPPPRVDLSKTTLFNSTSIVNKTATFVNKINAEGQKRVEKQSSEKKKKFTRNAWIKKQQGKEEKTEENKNEEKIIESSTARPLKKSSLKNPSNLSKSLKSVTVALPSPGKVENFDEAGEAEKSPDEQENMENSIREEKQASEQEEIPEEENLPEAAEEAEEAEEASFSIEAEDSLDSSKPEEEEKIPQSLKEEEEENPSALDCSIEGNSLNGPASPSTARPLAESSFDLDKSLRASTSFDGEIREALEQDDEKPEESADDEDFDPAATAGFKLAENEESSIRGEESTAATMEDSMDDFESSREESKNQRNSQENRENPSKLEPVQESLITGPANLSETSEFDVQLAATSAMPAGSIDGKSKNSSSSSSASVPSGGLMKKLSKLGNQLFQGKKEKKPRQTVGKPPTGKSAGDTGNSQEAGKAAEAKKPGFLSSLFNKKNSTPAKKSAAAQVEPVILLNSPSSSTLADSQSFDLNNSPSALRGPGNSEAKEEKSQEFEDSQESADFSSSDYGAYGKMANSAVRKSAAPADEDEEEENEKSSHSAEQPKSSISSAVKSSRKNEEIIKEEKKEEKKAKILPASPRLQKSPAKANKKMPEVKSPAKQKKSAIVKETPCESAVDEDSESSAPGSYDYIGDLKAKGILVDPVEPKATGGSKDFVEDPVIVGIEKILAALRADRTKTVNLTALAENFQHLQQPSPTKNSPAPPGRSSVPSVKSPAAPRSPLALQSATASAVLSVLKQQEQEIAAKRRAAQASRSPNSGRSQAD